MPRPLKGSQQSLTFDTLTQPHGRPSTPSISQGETGVLCCLCLSGGKKWGCTGVVRLRAKGWGRCVVWGGKWFPEASHSAGLVDRTGPGRCLPCHCLCQGGANGQVTAMSQDTCAGTVHDVPIPIRTGLTLGRRSQVLSRGRIGAES